jgi:hypothetical protein
MAACFRDCFLTLGSMRCPIRRQNRGPALLCHVKEDGGQLSEHDAKGVRSHRPFRRRRDPQNVILISKDSSLASLLEAMIARPRSLKILGSSSEFPGSGEFPADTVVLDLPYRVRWAACQQVRERYSGRMIVTVSNERETEGWPPDPACWFLVRPFGAEDVLRALRAPVPPGPAARAPLATRRRPAEREAAEPPRRPGVTEGASEQGSPARPEPVSRLSTDDSLWEVETAGAAPPAALPPVMEPRVIPLPVAVEPEVIPPFLPPPSAPEVVQAPAVEPRDPSPPALSAPPAPGAEGAEGASRSPGPAPPLPRSRRRSRRVLAEVVGALVLVVVAGLGGIAIGRASAPQDRLDVSAISTAPTPGAASALSSGTTPTTRDQILASTASCLSALDHSDAAISYLVGNIRDDRLSRSIQQYQVDRRVCRERVR